MNFRCLCLSSELNSFNPWLGELFNFSLFNNMKMQLWLVRTKNVPFHYLCLRGIGQSAMVTLKNLSIHVINKTILSLLLENCDKVFRREKWTISCKGTYQVSCKWQKVINRSTACFLFLWLHNRSSNLIPSQRFVDAHNSCIEIALLKKHFSQVCFT